MRQLLYTRAVCTRRSRGWGGKERGGCAVDGEDLFPAGFKIEFAAGSGMIQELSMYRGVAPVAELKKLYIANTR